MVQQPNFWVFIQKNENQDLKEIFLLSCSLWHYSHDPWHGISQISINRYIKKLCYARARAHTHTHTHTHTQWNIIQSLKRRKFYYMQQHGWIFKDIIPSEMCQSQKDKFCMIPLYEVVSKVVKPGDSLPVQWLGLHTLIVEGLCSIPGGELKSHQVHELHTMVKRFLIIKRFLFKKKRGGI